MRQYRPEIDGLRAVAVLPVVLFHAGLPGIGGGFVGVDVFFVISGYLIAAILLEERARGAFSYSAFYARRARRILPLLAVVCAVSVPVAMALMLPGDLKDFGASLAGAATFTLNLIAANNVGYFDRSAEVQPLLHIWSLAVEEQFYLLFPLLLPVILRMGGLWVVLALAALGVGLAEVWLRHDAAAAFYLPHTRGWTILIGVACALWERGRPPVAGHGGLAALGLGMIAAAVAGLSPGVGYPGVWTLLPVGGAALVLLFARPGTAVARLLAWRPMVGIGLTSYGLYLWHQPVLAFARYGREAPLTGTAVVLCLALILGLSVASWALVERPFRRARAAPGRVLGVAGAVSAAMIAAGAALVVLDGVPGRLSPDVLAILAAEEDRNPLRRTCSSNGARIVPPEEACVLGDRGAVIGALVGDSHADTLVVPLTARLEAAGLGMELLTYSGCPVVPGIRQRGAKDNRCDAYTDMVFDHLAARPDLRVIILHARWPFYLQGDGYDNGEGGVEEVPPGPFESRDLPPGSEDEPARKAAVVAAYAAGVQRLLDMGRTVILITPVPEVGWHVPRHMAFATLRDGTPPQVSTDAARFMARNEAVLAAFAALPPHPRLHVLHPYQALCDTDLAGRCIAARDGLPLYADPDHLTNTAAGALLVEGVFPWVIASP